MLLHPTPRKGGSGGDCTPPSLQSCHRAARRRGPSEKENGHKHRVRACPLCAPKQPALQGSCPPLPVLPQPHGPPHCRCSTRPGFALPQVLGTGCASHLECSSAFAHMSPPPRGLPGLPPLFKNVHPSLYPHTLPIIFPFCFSHHFTNTEKCSLLLSLTHHLPPTVLSGHRG